MESSDLDLDDELIDDCWQSKVEADKIRHHAHAFDRIRTPRLLSADTFVAKFA
jgi:hypothetical protein